MDGLFIWHVAVIIQQKWQKNAYCF